MICIKIMHIYFSYIFQLDVYLPCKYLLQFVEHLPCMLPTGFNVWHSTWPLNLPGLIPQYRAGETPSTGCDPKIKTNTHSISTCFFSCGDKRIFNENEVLAGNKVQWNKACFAFMSSWVWSPGTQREKYKEICV